MIVASWTIAVACTIPTCWTADVEYFPEIHHCGHDWSQSCPRSVIANTFLYVVMIPLTTFCYTSIALEIRKSQRRIAAFQLRVKNSLKRLGRTANTLGIEVDAGESTSHVYPTDDEGDDPSCESQTSQQQDPRMRLKDWEEYEREYQEICRTLRRAGSILDRSNYLTKKSKVKLKSTIRKRNKKLRSALGADKLVAIAGRT